MAGQYALPGKQSLAGPPGAPGVPPSARAAHAMLDTPVGVLVQKMAPQFASMVPADYARQPLRQVMKEANFVVKSMITSRIGPYLPPGVTFADLEKAVNQPPPPPEAKPAATVAPTPAVSPVTTALTKSPTVLTAPGTSKGSTTVAPTPAVSPVTTALTKSPTVLTAPDTSKDAPAVTPTPAVSSATTALTKSPTVLTAPGTSAAPAGGSQAGPKAFVLHHTGGGSSAKNIVEDWRVHRPGIGTQFIMDREGVVHDVEKEFGYTGHGQVHPKYTPKAFLDKGITNDNIVGIEIMAKNDKDVTPAQLASVAKFVNERYPNIPVYGHGELNPGHREADEGQTAKRAVMEARAHTKSVAEGTAAHMGPDGIPVPDTSGAVGPTNASGAPAGLDINRAKTAFLHTISRGEAPLGNYGLINGGGTITDFTKDPTGTAAAGQYQFLPSTWAEQKKKYGYKDFSPETQDLAAWNYARDVYGQKTGRKLDEDLISGDAATLNGISKALSGTWVSLPEGSQTNSNWKGKTFAEVYNENLSGKGEPAAEPATTATPAAPPAATPAETPVAAPAHADPAKTAGGMGGFGEALSAMAGGMYGGGKGGGGTQTAQGPTTIPFVQLPRPPGVQPIVDPRIADAQRQQLAHALQRLNSGKLI